MRSAASQRWRSTIQRDRDQQQAKLAASSPILDLEIVGGEVSITHRNLGTARVNYYVMDLEFLFSANPFIDNDTERFRFVKPNHSHEVKLVGEDVQTSFPLPGQLQNENVLVEVVGGGQSKARAHFANQLGVTVASAYGRLQVRLAGSDKPLPKTYIKVYARLSDGEVRFYKDGYTDLRGKFDYASLSAEEPDIDQVDRFAILAMHEAFGAVVEEVAPPNGRPRANQVRDPKSGPEPAQPDGAEGQGIRIKAE